MRRQVLAPLVAVLAGVVLVLGTTAVTGASVGDKDLKCQPKSASKAIAETVNAGLHATSGAEEAKAYALKPAQVDAFAAALQQHRDALDAPVSSYYASLQARVGVEQCHGKTKADFAYALRDPGGRPAGGGLGKAVLKKGKWLLDPVDACDQFSERADAAAAACYAAIGLTGPTP